MRFPTAVVTCVARKGVAWTATIPVTCAHHENCILWLFINQGNDIETHNLLDRYFIKIKYHTKINGVLD